MDAILEQKCLQDVMQLCAMAQLAGLTAFQIIATLDAAKYVLLSSCVHLQPQEASIIIPIKNPGPTRHLKE